MCPARKMRTVVGSMRPLVRRLGVRTLEGENIWWHIYHALRIAISKLYDSIAAATEEVIQLTMGRSSCRAVLASHGSADTCTWNPQCQQRAHMWTGNTQLKLDLALLLVGYWFPSWHTLESDTKVVLFMISMGFRTSIQHSSSKYLSISNDMAYQFCRFETNKSVETVSPAKHNMC